MKVNLNEACSVPGPLKRRGTIGSSLEQQPEATAYSHYGLLVSFFKTYFSLYKFACFQEVNFYSNVLVKLQKTL